MLSSTLVHEQAVHAEFLEGQRVVLLVLGGEGLQAGKGWVYHGRIDNRYVQLGKARPAATHEDLEEALAAVLAGTPVKVSSTRAIGCSIPVLP